MGIGIETVSIKRGEQKIGVNKQQKHLLAHIIYLFFLANLPFCGVLGNKRNKVSRSCFPGSNSEVVQSVNIRQLWSTWNVEIMQ